MTVAVLVPAAWHGSDATIENDGKRIRPLQKDFMVDGARVTLEVDRSLIETGDSVVAKLRAYSDTNKTVAVDLTVMQSDDEFGSRVAAPPKAIDKEHFTLEAAPDGGKVVTTKLTLEPNSGEADKIDWFRIYAAAKGTKIDVWGGQDVDGDGPPPVAAISVLGWSTNDFGMTIKPKGKLTAGEPFEVTVRVENTTKSTLKHAPYVHLGTSVGLYGIEEGEDYKIEEVDDDQPDDYDKKFRPGDVRTAKFRVAPVRADVTRVTFIASAYTYGDDMGGIDGGAMEAKSFKIAPAEVAAK